MKTILCLFVFFVSIISSVSPAAADFDVLIDSNLTNISIPLGDSVIVIPFKDGVATWISKPDKKVFIGFYTEESLKKAVQAENEKAYTVSVFGVTPNVGNIYLVIRGISGDDHAFYAWPIQFSAFGIGVHSADGKVYHNGLALFGTHAFRDMETNKKPF